MTDSGKPDTTALAPASGKKPARFSRGRILRVVAVGLVAGACIGTVTGVSGMVERADKKVATERWGELAEPGKDPAERAYEGRHDTPLSKLLLPASDYALGPDSGERGNDTEVDGAEAVAAVKETLRGLPQKLRRDMEKQLDRSGVEGAAMRTYARTDNDTFFAEMNISVVKDTQVIRDRYRRVTSLLRSIGVDKGPKVKGHRDAACFRFKGERKKDVQELYCAAAKGKHFVSMSAELPGDGSVKPPAELFAAQLDHLASPGEYV
ncbi:hypothetical protein [Streptomyces koyangensis]|uniref:Secreted protein n=1 Tax=Streptomyces koyangensis TaxID=188770 RepID=A0ABX7EGM8_9ACTN|nr:hypothetical protein [Streptomyces koyangensis]QRF03679.1 hypothetical protein G9U55_16815 [Streptomyces koyangensis]